MRKNFEDTERELVNHLPDKHTMSCYPIMFQISLNITVGGPQYSMIGKILKSLDDTTGEPSRGARYNSALSYVSSMKKENNECFIIVYSEDGMIDVLNTYKVDK